MSHSKSNVYVIFLFRKVYLDENNNIKSTECECPRGAFKCSHAAAIFVYGIHNLSRTDTECQWKKKKSTPSVEAASEMFPPPKKYNPLGRQPAREDRAALKIAHVPVQLWRHFVLARKFKSFCSKLLSYFLLYLYISCI